MLEVVSKTAFREDRMNASPFVVAIGSAMAAGARFLDRDLIAAEAKQDIELSPAVPGLRKVTQVSIAALLAISVMSGILGFADTAMAATKPCAKVAFIGARGSGEEFQNKFGYSNGEGYGKFVNQTRVAFAKNIGRLHAETDYAPLNFTAHAVDVLWTPGLGEKKFFEGVDQGISQLTTELVHRNETCPDQVFVLAGYSQGAMVIHRTLLGLSSSIGRDKILSRVVAVELIADPMRTSGSPTNFGSAGDSNGAAIYFQRAVPADVPQPVRAATRSLCKLNDGVCDARIKTLGLTKSGAVAPDVIGGALKMKRTHSIHTKQYVDLAEFAGIHSASLVRKELRRQASRATVPTATSPAPADKLDAKALEGTILRREDGISWVVQAGRRVHIPTYAADLCAQFVDGLPVSKTGLTAATAKTIPESNKKYACSLDRTILTAMDKADPKPSYAYYGGSRHWIADPWTYRYLIGQGFRAVNVANEGMIHQLSDGGTEPRKLDRSAIPTNSIVRRSDGVSWVVDGNRELHHIPFVQDDVCWRHLKGYPVSATGLTDGQVRTIGPEKDKWPCIIGDRVVKSSDGSSHFVDRANSRHWIPDSDTFWTLARQHQVVGPWPAGDVNGLPEGPHERRRLDPEGVKNSIVCRSDGVCWAVDTNAIRHHIPNHADNVCWRWVNGWKVSRNGVTAEQANSLQEQGAWGCNLHNRIIATNEGAAYYMEGNTRRWIQDVESFHCYADRGSPVIRGIGMAEVRGIGEGHWMPRCLSPHRVKGKIVRVGDGTAYFVDGGGLWHWIPNGGIWGCLTGRYPVLIQNASWEQVNSLRKEGAHAHCGM
jgi:sulfur transfer complex TusBCD TusB component (DsrH family)